MSEDIEESILLCYPIALCKKRWPIHETTCARCAQRIGYSEGSKRTIPPSTRFLCRACGVIELQTAEEVTIMPRSPHQQVEWDAWERRQ